MMSQDNSNIGKRVFFLHPHSVIQNEMIDEIIAHEFEVYLISDIPKTLKLMEKYPDSILFINIDEGQEESAWEQYIQSIIKNETMSDVRIGILTYNNDPDLARKYLMDIGVQCGFIKLSLGLQESTDIILRALSANEAKGRRKYVRAKITDPGSAGFNVNAKGMTRNGHVLDISSVGMAVSFDGDSDLEIRSQLPDIQLRLRGILTMVSGVILGNRSDDSSVYVVLFTGKTPDQSRLKIRTFVFQTLQNNIERELTGL
jgi:hypothetical protein